ncbi:hypothetical protein [Edaphobacter modestus]|uniref:Oligosaccharide repeat unit polymerase n=1 Tax=Edaphobacter modestus TaxID=388466 RepID=A0A4Q7YPH6_9BACT|nr:hypothetical protein [Edaphobacter modestus]RZU38964.1 hypothetical protein BDD14_0279 [Edaphobacter modestus]
MFELLLVAAVLVVLVGIFSAMDGSRDVFHPLILIGPMMILLYGWIPWRIYSIGGLDQFFDQEQLVFVQTLNVLGILAFVAGCLASGIRLRPEPGSRRPVLSETACRRLLIGAALVGSLGLLCWAITIVNVGGFVNAYSNSYAGGWDDSGYVRDGTLLLLVGTLLSITALASNGPRLPSFIMLGFFGIPWASQALLMARRGPTFALVVIVLMGWYLSREKRPPVLSVGLGGVFLGWFVLFLVTNRSSIYLGSSFDVKTDVGAIVDKPDSGNEFIYGSGTILSAQRRDHYFWMRRYLAQILVRPIPSAIWPTKYEDFGVPELRQNAGTGEGFGDALGWVGAVGSAPGIIADLWIEAWWLCIPLMALLGWVYAFAWKRAVTRGGPWASQYIVLSALSIYLVMQTMEAVIFRALLLSIPCWLIWRWALQSVPLRHRRPQIKNAYPMETIEHA